MIWRNVAAVPSRRQVDGAVGQGEGGTRQLAQGVVGHCTADRAVTGAGDFRSTVGVGAVVERRVGDDDRTAELFAAVGQADSVQPLDEMVVAVEHLLRLGDDVKGLRRGVDDGRAGDADLRTDAGAANSRAGNGRHRRTGQAGEKTIVPEHLTAVGVDCVETVVLGGDEDHIMKTCAGAGGDVDVGGGERLRIDLPVHGGRKQFAEGRAIQIRRREDGFVRVDAGVAGVVVMAQHICRGDETVFELFEVRAGAARIPQHDTSPTMTRMIAAKPSQIVCKRRAEMGSC